MKRFPAKQFPGPGADCRATLASKRRIPSTPQKPESPLSETVSPFPPRFGFPQQLFPIGARCGFIFVFAELVVNGSGKGIRQILLPDKVVGEIVRVEVELSFPFDLSTIVMLILQAAWESTAASSLYIGHCRVDRFIGGVGFGGGSHQDNRHCQRDACFGQPELEGTVHARFHDRSRLRVGQPHVLTCNDQQTPAGGDQIP